MYIFIFFSHITSFDADDASTTLGNVSDITTDLPTEENDEPGDTDRNGDTNDGDHESVSSDSSSPNTTTYVLMNVPSASQPAPADALAEFADDTSTGTLDPDPDEGLPDDTARPRLIRSNSYTLLTPSPAFLKHLQSHGLCLNEPATLPLSSVHCESHIPHTVEQQQKKRLSNSMMHNSCDSLAPSRSNQSIFVSKSKSQHKNALLPAAQRSRRPSIERIYAAKGPANDSKKVALTASQLHQQQRLRRLYDPKSTKPKTSSIRPHSDVTLLATVPPASPCTTAVTVPTSNCINVASGRSSLSQTPPARTGATSVATSTDDNCNSTTSKSDPCNSNDNIVQLIARMEADRRQQMDELIARQELEQQRQQAAFMEQQRLLVQQITAHCTSMIDQLSRQQAALPLQSPHPASPSVCLATRSNDTSIGSSSNSTLRSTDKPKPGTSTQRRLFADTMQVTDATPTAERLAATRINACVRGYLTRRLFRTEDVQTVVKVIRDTLLFVMDLYREQRTNSGDSARLSETDANLRRSLLKQVSFAGSMSTNLHIMIIIIFQCILFEGKLTSYHRCISS